MTAPPLDLAPLLAPVAPESPTGEWLRYERIYDEIRALREEDDPTLPQGVWQRELKRADWRAVAERSAEVLATRSKDLQLAAWLVEAWIHLHAFPGLEKGLRLVTGLCRDFWDTLYPPLEEGNAEARLAPIAWMADKLLLPVKKIPVTAPQSEDAVPYTWADWEAGLHLANLARLDPAAAAKAQERSGMVPQAKFLVSVSLTPAPWFGALTGEAAGTLAALDELEAVLAERCGDAVPSLAPLKAPLAALQTFAFRVLEERGEKGLAAGVPGEGGTDAPDGDEGAEPSAARAASRSDAISSRADAYRRLSEAADYLQRTEPHSPVPYLVRRAISWGNMSLAELLQELLQKNADLPTIYALLGIKRSS